MITQTTIYKHLSKWTGSDHPLFQYLLYFRDGVAATNTHQAIFIFQQNLSCKLETINGKPGDVLIPIEDQRQGYTDLETWMSNIVRSKFTKIKPKSDNILWVGKFDVSTTCLKKWKSTLELLCRLSRKKSRFGIDTPVILAKEGTNLVAYVYKNQYCAAKFYLYTDLPVNDNVQWKGTFNIEFLCNFIDLLLDLNLTTFTLSITTHTYPLMLLESQKIWAVSTCYNLLDNSMDELKNFYRVVNTPIRTPISGGDESGILV